MRRFLPFLEWFRDYDLAALRVDLISGVTVALVLVPQSMAYAQLAGLPPYYGLYAAFLPPMVASLFGSSRQLATGPVAVVSLMTAAALEPLATAGSTEYIAYAVMLALMVGVFQLLLGVLRLGLVVNLLSHPVVNGFTNAAALIIATSQLDKIFGVSVEKGDHHYQTVARVVVAAVNSTHLPTLAMAVLAFAIMVGLRRLNPRIPNVLVAVVATVLLSWALGFERNVKVDLADIPSERLTQLVHRYDQVLAERSMLVELRSSTDQILTEAAGDASHFCERCHPRRELEEFRSPSRSAESEPGMSSRAFALHQMAGLIGTQIEDLDAHVAAIRSELRTFRFDRVTAGDGTERFYVRGEVPEGIPFERGRWRIKLGGNPLGETLTLVGGGTVVATIPSGLPPLAVPTFNPSILPRLGMAAIIISILGFMEAISIAKAMAARTRQRLDPNQELIGQGLANIVGCFNQGYAVSGSFSRSAVNLQSGARTGLSSVFSSVVVALVLLFLSGTLYHLPQSVLAAIIMMAVVGLLNVSGFVHAWRTQRFDGVVSVVTFATTLYTAPELELGIALGVLLSLGGYMLRSMRPRLSQLAPHPDGSLRDISRHGLDQCPHLAVVSFEGPLNFASTSYLEDAILGRVAALPKLRHLLVAGHGISELDASGEESLRQLVERLRSAGYQVSFSGLNDGVLDVLRRAHLYDVIGEDNFFATQVQAITAIFPSAHAGGEDPGCPFRAFMPRISELSLHPDGSLRDARRHELAVCSHLAILRFEGPLNQGTAVFLEEEALSLTRVRTPLRQFLFVMHGVTDLTTGGATRLAMLVANLRDSGLGVAFSGFKDEALEVLERTGADEVLGESNLHPTQVMAVAAVYAGAHRGSDEARCPLRSLAPHLTELSLHPDGSLRDAHRHGLTLCDRVAVLRVDGSLAFASADALAADFATWREGRPEVTHVVFAAHTVAALHPRDADNLLAFAETVKESGLEIAFAHLNDQVFEVLAQSGVADRVGLERFFATEVQALAAFYAVAHPHPDETICPLARAVPRVTDLSLHPDGSLRDAQRHGLALCRHVAAIRFDGPLNFATIQLLESELDRRLTRRTEVRQVLIAAHTLERVDAVAAERLCALVGRLRHDGYGVAFSGLRDDVLEVLELTGCQQVLGAGSVFPTQAAALAEIHAAAHEGSDEDPCPLLDVVRRLE